MENLDIYILTSIVATLFAVFGITIYREFARMQKDGYQYDPNAKKYGRDALFDLAVKLFEEEGLATKVNKKEKKEAYKAMYRTMADMESDGVYFSEDDRKEIIK